MNFNLDQNNRNAKWQNTGTRTLPNSVFILSDKERAPDIGKIINCAPKNAKIIIRNHKVCAFSHLITSSNRKQILATIAPKEALGLGILGVHIPNARLKYFRQCQRHDLKITVSAHNGHEVCRALRANIRTILISPIFKSDSPSVFKPFVKPLGPIRMAILARRFKKAQFVALGGINHKTAKRLKRAGVKAIAGVSFLKTPA